MNKRNNYKERSEDTLKNKKFFGFYLTPANIFFVLMISFLIGVVFRMLFEISALEIIFILILLLLTLVVFYFSVTNFKILVIIFILLGFIGGILRTNQSINKSLGWLEMEYEGPAKIKKFSESKDDYQRVYVEIKGKKINNRGKIIIKKEPQQKKNQLLLGSVE